MTRIRNWKDLICSDPALNAAMRTWIRYLPHRSTGISSQPCCPICCALRCRSKRVMSRPRQFFVASQRTVARTSFTRIPGTGSNGRIIFLLHYLSSVELPHTIEAATNKSEAFNKFRAVGVFQW